MPSLLNFDRTEGRIEKYGACRCTIPTKCWFSGQSHIGLGHWNWIVTETETILKQGWAQSIASAKSESQASVRLS